jgi:hypothetical protein
MRPYLENTQCKTGLAEWLKWQSYLTLTRKYEALSSNPSTAKKKKKKDKEKKNEHTQNTLYFCSKSFKKLLKGGKKRIKF